MSASRIPRRPHETPAQASFAQERLWFMEKLAPSSCAFNLLNGYAIRGPLDRVALERAVRAIMERHEALRTNLVQSDGKVRQAVSPAQEGAFEFVDLSRLPGGGLREAEEEALGRARRPYDLSKDPLFSTVLFKTGRDEHLLAVLAHHSVFDGWSFRLFADELAAIYSAFTGGKASPPAEPGVQYSDYSDWQRARFEEGGFERGLGYWRGALGKDLPVLELPTDRPRGAQQPCRGESIRVWLSPGTTDGLKGLGLKNGCTLYMTLLAAFFAYLHRYSGNDSIVVGCPVAGRGMKELEGMMGFFVNTLPMKADLSGDPSFLDLLKEVRRAALEAYSNQDVPFDRIVEELQPQRDLSRSPVYQTLFQLRNFPVPAPGSGSISLVRHDFGWATAQVDLFMDIEEEGQGLRCKIEYPSELFDRGTVERMARHWVRLLEGVVENPSRRISGLPLMADEELRMVLSDWNQTGTAYPRDMCIHQLFEERASGNPEAVAIAHRGASLSYREVNERANQLARFLVDGGLAPGEPVGICMERSPEMVISYLAILKAGGAYVPLDPDDPPHRLGVIINDVKGRMIITKSRHEGRLPVGSRGIVLEKEAESIGSKSVENMARGADPMGMAYVIYTSGSTGAPKGVCCHHRGVVRLVADTNYVRFSPGDTVVHASNPTFDPTSFEVWGALINGARLLILDKEVALSNDEFAKALGEGGADVMFLTTTLFHLKAKEAPSSFKGLRELFVGGEAMDPASARSVLAAAPPKRLINFYGPTENTGFSTFHDVGDVPEGTTTIPIGKNIANSKSYILDRNLRPVPVGVKGEIYVAGDGVALGYFNNPKLTKASFVPDPFTPGSMMYKTGDLGRFLADGSIEFLGRADLQVKVRGFRVEVGEVESVLLSHPSVRLAAVVPRGRDGRERQLFAYVLPHEGVAVGAAELRSHMKERLPDYMVPRSFTILESMPLTPTGKIDRKALPEPADTRGEGSASTAQEGGMESRLAAIWARALGVGRVGREDDFFELGGHSLLAVRLCSAIEDEFKVSLPVATLFRAPTVALLAKELQRSHPKGGSSLVPLRTTGSRPALFLVHSGDGEVRGYARLVKALGDEQPVYGLRAIGLDGEGSLPKTVREMASAYVREMKSAYPKGPYHIAGWCAGGVIAFEMAQQLLEQGEKIGLVGILNFEAPGRKVRPTPRQCKNHFIKNAVGPPE